MALPRPTGAARWGRWALLTPALLSCSLVPGLAATPTPRPSPTPTVTPTVQPTATTVPTVAPSATPPPLTVFASGNLNVRRGPGLAYNIVGFLANGETADVLGQNEDGTWLYIEVPSNPGRLGWVTADSPYLSASGPTGGLPQIPYDAAVPAYLRNCTFHTMRVNPGGFELRSQVYPPENERQVNPGHYEAADLGEAGEPIVFSADIREGGHIDITKDGLGNVYACP
jgi:uncharacterized protein YraI